MDWVEEATCRQVDPEVWFPDYQGQQWDAVRICVQCPVQYDCLTASFDDQEEFGVWGGMTQWEREGLLPKYMKKTYVERPFLISRLIAKIDNDIEKYDANKRAVNERRLERNARRNQEIRDELKARGLSSRGRSQS